MRFDYILAGSLFSHLGAEDSNNYFSSISQYADSDTRFLFSLFLDPKVLDTQDADPISQKCIIYNPSLVESLLRAAGWGIERAYLRDWNMRSFVPDWNTIPLNSIVGMPAGGQSFY